MRLTVQKLNLSRQEVLDDQACSQPGPDGLNIDTGQDAMIGPSMDWNKFLHVSQPDLSNRDEMIIWCFCSILISSYLICAHT